MADDLQALIEALRGQKQASDIQSMSHMPQQWPEKSPESIQNVNVIGGYFQGGVPGAMRAGGMDVPPWMDKGKEYADMLAQGAELGMPGQPVGPRWTGIMRRAFLDAAKEGKTPEDLAKQFKMTPFAAKALIKNQGMPARGISDPFSDTETLQKLTDMLKARAPTKTIAQEVGVSPPTVRKKARELGVPKDIKE